MAKKKPVIAARKSISITGTITELETKVGKENNPFGVVTIFSKETKELHKVLVNGERLAKLAEYSIGERVAIVMQVTADGTCWLDSMVNARLAVKVKRSTAEIIDFHKYQEKIGRVHTPNGWQPKDSCVEVTPGKWEVKIQRAMDLCGPEFVTKKLRSMGLNFANWKRSDGNAYRAAVDAMLSIFGGKKDGNARED